jgi:hypothetical protein
MIWGGFVLLIRRLLHEFPHPFAVRDVRRLMGVSQR